MHGEEKGKYKTQGGGASPQAHWRRIGMRVCVSVSVCTCVCACVCVCVRVCVVIGQEKRERDKIRNWGFVVRLSFQSLCLEIERVCV